MKKAITLSILVLASIGCSSNNPVEKAKATPVMEERKKDPEGSKEALAAGNIALQQKNWEMAIARYKTAAEKDEDNWESYMNAAIATIMTADSQKALELIQNALAHGGAKEQVVYFNLGNIYQERGLFYAAIDAYRAGLAVGDPDDFDSITNIAAAYVLVSDWDKAEETYKHLKDLRPEDPTSYLGFAMVEQGRGDLASALKSFEKLNSRFPNFAPAYYNKGYLLEELDKLREAITAYETYLRLMPKGPAASRAESSIKGLKKRLNFK